MDSKKKLFSRKILYLFRKTRKKTQKDQEKILKEVWSNILDHKTSQEDQKEKLGLGEGQKKQVEEGEWNKVKLEDGERTLMN